MKKFIKRCFHRGEPCEYFTLSLFLDGKRISCHTDISESEIDAISAHWMAQ
jgi:hypothetical protein